jgi:hypothetical protein
VPEPNEQKPFLRVAASRESAAEPP